MVLTAAAAPMLMVAPPLLDTRSAAAMPPAAAVTCEVSSAVIVAAVAGEVSVTGEEVESVAATVLSMTFCDPAPAPEKVAPEELAPPVAARPPATVRASIVEALWAPRESVAAETVVAPVMLAATSEVMSLAATAIPMARPVGGPRARRIATPPASTLMVDEFVALRLMPLTAAIVPPLSVANTLLVIEFPAPLPAPAKPAPPPEPLLTERAIPRAKTLMEPDAVAVAEMEPPASSAAGLPPAQTVLSIWLTAAAAPTVTPVLGG